MARYIVQHRVSDSEGLQDFDSGGYAYQPDASTPERQSLSGLPVELTRAGGDARLPAVRRRGDCRAGDHGQKYPLVTAAVIACASVGAHPHTVPGFK